MDEDVVDEFCSIDRKGFMNHDSRLSMTSFLTRDSLLSYKVMTILCLMYQMTYWTLVLVKFEDCK